MCCRYGIKGIVLFPLIDANLKTNMAEEAYNPEGLVPQFIKAIKNRFPDLIVCTDVALDPYSNQVGVGSIIFIRKTGLCLIPSVAFVGT